MESQTDRMNGVKNERSKNQNHWKNTLIVCLVGDSAEKEPNIIREATEREGENEEKVSKRGKKKQKQKSVNTIKIAFVLALAAAQGRGQNIREKKQVIFSFRNSNKGDFIYQEFSS